MAGAAAGRDPGRDGSARLQAFKGPRRHCDQRIGTRVRRGGRGADDGDQPMSENLHPRADEIDDLSALEFVALMHAEDVAALNAITPRLEDVARAVEAVTERLSSGGRLHYFGAGTSGLIARLDAAECPATFGVAPDLVQAYAVDEAAAEDDRDLGRDTARGAGIGPRDAVVGISASGGTAYVLGALDRSASEGALQVAITCHPG